MKDVLELTSWLKTTTKRSGYRLNDVLREAKQWNNTEHAVAWLEGRKGVDWVKVCAHLDVTKQKDDRLLSPAFILRLTFTIGLLLLIARFTFPL